MKDTALFFHLLGAFLLVAGTIVAGVAFEAGRRRKTPAEVALILGLSRYGVVLVGLGVVLVLVFGFWLIHLGNWGTDGWVDGAFALFLIAVALGAIGGQAPKKARLLATRLAESGEPISDELRAILRNRTALAANYGSALLMLLIIVLMVWKPGASHS